MLTMLPIFPAQNLSLALWAFGRFSYLASATFLEASGKRMAEVIANCNPQNLANTLWSFATLETDPGKCLIKVKLGKSLVFLLPTLSGTDPVTSR